MQALLIWVVSLDLCSQSISNTCREASLKHASASLINAGCLTWGSLRAGCMVPFKLTPRWGPYCWRYALYSNTTHLFMKGHSDLIRVDWSLVISLWVSSLCKMRDQRCSQSSCLPDRFLIKFICATILWVQAGTLSPDRKSSRYESAEWYQS